MEIGEQGAKKDKAQYRRVKAAVVEVYFWDRGNPQELSLEGRDDKKSCFIKNHV